MLLGAGLSVDLCAREYIPAPAHTPTIYHGMPLRTEFRAFIDLDEHGLLGITPYWHPAVMKQALRLADTQGEGYGHISGDHQTFLDNEARLQRSFEMLVPDVARHLELLIPALQQAGMAGAWSLDIMLDVDREVFWLIDMALMSNSALADQLYTTDEYARVGPSIIEPLANPVRPRFCTDDDLDRYLPGLEGLGGLTAPGATYRYHWDNTLAGESNHQLPQEAELPATE